MNFEKNIIDLGYLTPNQKVTTKVKMIQEAPELQYIESNCKCIDGTYNKVHKEIIITHNVSDIPIHLKMSRKELSVQKTIKVHFVNGIIEEVGVKYILKG